MGHVKKSFSTLLQMIMDRYDLQEVIDYAALFLDSAIAVVEQSATMDILVHSKNIHVRDPYWEEAFHTGFCSQEFCENVFYSRYMKTLSSKVQSGLSYPPDNVSLKYWLHLPEDSSMNGITMIAMPVENEFSEKKQKVFRSFAWAIKYAYLEKSTSESLMRRDERQELLQAIDHTAIYQKSEPISNYIIWDHVQIVVANLEFKNITNSLWQVLLNNMDDILSNHTAIIYEDQLVALASRLSQQERQGLIKFAKRFDAKIGISWTFSGRESAYNHYRQATSAIKLSSKLRSYDYINEFDQYFIYHILNLCHHNQDFNLCSHPALKLLKTHDKQYKSELYKTFELYLKNDCHKTLTANELGIPNSTLQHRIDVIYTLLTEMEIYNIPSNLMTSLLFSYDIECIKNATTND